MLATDLAFTFNFPISSIEGKIKYSSEKNDVQVQFFKTSIFFLLQSFAT